MEKEKNKGGRPKKENPFNYTQSFQITEEEKAALMYMAIRLNCSMSEVVRKVFRLAILHTHHDAEDECKYELTDAYGVDQFDTLRDAWKIVSKFST